MLVLLTRHSTRTSFQTLHNIQNTHTNYTIKHHDTRQETEPIDLTGEYITNRPSLHNNTCEYYIISEVFEFVLMYHSYLVQKRESPR